MGILLTDTPSFIGEIAPHGDVLVDRILRGVEREATRERAACAKKISRISKYSRSAAKICSTRK